MKIWSIFIILLLMFRSSFTAAADSALKINKTMASKKYELKWNTSLTNNHYDSETDSSNLINATIGLQGTGNLTSYLSIYGDMNLQWTSGRNQSWYGSSKNKSGIKFNEIVVRLRPSTFVDLELAAGAPSLAYINSPILISGTPFPGVKGSALFPIGSLANVKLMSLYSIPSSDSLDSDRTEKEAEPTFIAHTVEVESTILDALNIKTYGTSFQYKNLPSLVAKESILLGNSITAISESSFMFEYQFKGLLLGVESDINIFGHELKVGFQRLENKEAPTGKNRGELAFIESNLVFGYTTITPRVEKFFNESDSGPGYYNSSSYGHNNREGNAVALTTTFGNNFSIKTRYSESTIINVNNTSSSDDQQIFIALETMYESI